MSPAKVARVLAALQLGRGNYLALRDRLFAGETVQTLADKIEAYQRGESARLSGSTCVVQREREAPSP